MGAAVTVIVVAGVVILLAVAVGVGVAIVFKNKGRKNDPLSKTMVYETYEARYRKPSYPCPDITAL